MNKKLSTSTVGHDADNPSHSYVDGHVVLKVFQRAYDQEWSGGTDLVQDDLVYGYAKKLKKSIRFSREVKEGFKPTTWIEW